MTVRFISIIWLALIPLVAEAGPLHIEGKRMLLDHKANRVEFNDRVLLTRDDFQLQCDRLVAHYQKGREKLEKAEAFGHVRMRQGNTFGQSDKALLNQQKGTLTLMGNAFIEQQGNRIEGQTITHQMRKQQTTVTPDEKGRSRMILETDKPQAFPAPGVQP